MYTCIIVPCGLQLCSRIFSSIRTTSNSYKFRALEFDTLEKRDFLNISKWIIHIWLKIIRISFRIDHFSTTIMQTSTCDLIMFTMVRSSEELGAWLAGKQKDCSESWFTTVWGTTPTRSLFLEDHQVFETRHSRNWWVNTVIQKKRTRNYSSPRNGRIDACSRTSHWCGEHPAANALHPSPSRKGGAFSRSC